MVTKHDGNFEKTACESPDSQQLQLGNADYDVNVAVQYRHQLQILIYDEWTLLQMAIGFKANYYTKPGSWRNTRKEELRALSICNQSNTL